MSVTQQMYQEITETVVGLLEQGVVPWHKPWSVPGSEPQNLLSRKFYRGLNPFLLNCQPYTSPFWLTFRQAKKLGGHVRKGEKSTRIWFWKWWTKEDPDKRPGEISSRELDGIPVLRRYRLFNVEQCDGLEHKIPELPGDTRNEWERIEAAERIIGGMPNPPAIEHGHRAAWFKPLLDLVGMPDRDRFQDAAGYYSTVLHELVHASGAKSRLNRKGADATHRFGSPTYSREELVAEMGAAFLCGHAGISHLTVEASASYLDGWIRRMKGDPKLVMQAGSAAQKAVDYILGRLSGSDPDTAVPASAEEAID